MRGLLHLWRHGSMQNPETPAPSPEPTPQPSPDPTPAPEPTAVSSDPPEASPSGPGQPAPTAVSSDPPEASPSGPGQPAPTPPAQQTEEDTSYRTRLQEASANLTASEIPSAEQVPRLLGALLFEHDNGELPGPLHERFPDHYPNPNE